VINEGEYEIGEVTQTQEEESEVSQELEENEKIL
jgi:hypothetical protein